jgi:hypothetical protein
VKKSAYEKRLIITGIIILILLITLAQISLQSELGSKGLSGIIETVGVPLDDVYIHCRYAENLLAGNGYCFNPGATVTADTSPLWVLLIAAGGLLTSHLELVAVILSVLFHLVLTVSVYRLSHVLGIDEYWSQAIAILTFISGRLMWSAMSGMEVSLACAIVVVALWSYFTGRPRLTALLVALGVATRPELWLLVAIIFCDQLIRVAKRESRLATLITGALIFLAVIFPVLLLPLMERGSIVFHSSVVQGAQLSFLPDWGYLWFASKILFATVIPPFVLGLCGVYAFRSDARYRIMGAFAFGLPILLAFVAPQFRHHGRYFFPVIPLVIVLGSVFIAEFLRRQRTSNRPIKFWVKYPVTFYILYILAGVGFIRLYKTYYHSIANIAEQHVAAAKWVADNTTAEDVVASHDVGAIGYFTKKPIIDLVGLVTPEVYPLMHDQKLVWQYARSQGATIFIIYNRLNPTFYAYAKDSLELQSSFRVDPLVASADTVLNIYRVKQP